MDMWRITRALEAQPWDYTRYTDAIEGAMDAFRLRPGGPLYQVVLAKRGEVSPEGAPCIFLWKLADGHAQCGLGTLRPMVCRVYPAVLVDGMLYTESAACTCRRWSVVDLDRDEEMARFDRMLDEATEYSAIVAGWNESLEKEQRECTYREFCRYVLETYTSRYGESNA
jgi:Fe-S-cluster containining protein